MTLAAFQQALSLMTLDVTLASAVRHQGAPALVAFELTPLELRRLLGLAQQDGMELNCTLARANRFAVVHDAFAMSCVLLGPALRGVLDRLWAGALPGSYQLTGDAERFADVAMEEVQALAQEQALQGTQPFSSRSAHHRATRRADLSDDVPAPAQAQDDDDYSPPCPYLAEVLDYEQQAYRLAMSVRQYSDPLRARTASVWVDFQHDPLPIFEALRRFEQPPRGLPRAPHRVRLAVVDGALETTTFEVSSRA